MLDGLESESFGRVCVMLTAMDIDHLPPALVRSGRVELWLEMKLADPAARRLILEQRLRDLGQVFPDVKYQLLVERTAGFTGADLKHVVEDAKGLLRFATVSGAPARSPNEFLFEAIDRVAVNKSRYAQAEATMRAVPSTTAQASFPLTRDDRVCVKIDDPTASFGRGSL